MLIQLKINLHFIPSANVSLVFKSMSKYLKLLCLRTNGMKPIRYKYPLRGEADSNHKNYIFFMAWNIGSCFAVPLNINMEQNFNP